jgi:hypothetical protein
MASLTAAPSSAPLLRGPLLEVGGVGAHGGDADGLVLGDDLAARVRHGGMGGGQIGALLVDDDVLVGAIAPRGGAAGDTGGAGEACGHDRGDDCSGSSHAAFHSHAR